MMGNRLWAHLVFVLLNYQYSESIHSLDSDEKYLEWFRNTIEHGVSDVLEVPPWSSIVEDQNIKIQNLQVRNLKHLLINRTTLREVTQENGTIKVSFLIDLKRVKMKGFIDVFDSKGHLRQGQLNVSLSGRGHFTAIIEKSSCLAVFKVPVVMLNDPKYRGQEPIIHDNIYEQLTSELRRRVEKVINRKLNRETIKLPPEMCQEVFGGH